MLMNTHDQFAGIVRRADKARDQMRAWFPMFEELAHYFYNIRKGFLTETVPGQEPDPDIWDSTPEEKRAKLSESFVEAMCPKDRFWIGIEPARKELMQVDEVRYWCQLAAYYMYLVIYDPKANFSEAIAELADDSCTFGTAVMLVDYDRTGRHLVFCVKHLKNIAVEVDANGKLRRFYCYWMMSTEDIIDEFGMDALPSEMRDEFLNAKDGGGSCSEKKHEIIHAIMPDDDYARRGAGIGRKPFSSLWILRKGSHLLDKGSYEDIPYVLVRWYRKTDEALGRCDTMRAITDARLLQSVASALLEITEKQGNPPMQMPIDIIRGDVELWPGGANFFDASGFQFQGDPIRPIQIGANPAMTAEFMEKLQRKIGRTFHEDLLSLPEDGGSPEQHMSMEMMKAVILAPLWSRTENETMPPILDRVFDIMLRMRALPPIPPALIGETLVYKLDNKIADMRQMAKAKQTFDALAMPLQLQHPEIVETAVENIDWDIAFRDLWSMTRVPQNYIRSMQDVVADRQQRAQEQQMAKMAELAKAGGPGIQKAVEGAVQARDQGLLPAQ
jgi:hypothetical protein